MEKLVKVLIRITSSVATATAICLTCISVQAQNNATFITNVRVLVHDYDGLREGYYENDPDLKVISHTVDGIGTATATGQLGFGYNKVSASFDASYFNNPAGRMMADARTFWNDEVIIDSPGLTGTVGTFTASLRINGNANFHMDGGYATEEAFADLYGFWDAWIGTSTDGGGSYLVGGWFGSWYSDQLGGTDYYGDDLNQPMTDVELEFIYGQPFLLGGDLEAYFDAENPDFVPGTVGGSMDFSHSAYWDGIHGFFDANGNPVQAVSLISQSGIDWRLPVLSVPEPVLSWLFAFGLAVFVGTNRRRSRVNG